MGTFAGTRVTFTRGERPTMGMHRRPRLSTAPLAALLALAAAAPAWAQQGSSSGQVDQSLRRSDDERKLNQEPPSINVQDKPELKRQDDSKVHLKLRSIIIKGNVSFATD